MATLYGKKIAILVTDGFEQVELTEPVRALKEVGAETIIISPKQDTVRSWKNKQWDEDYPVDVFLGEANAEDYDALLLPGGVMNPDQLRMEWGAVEFVKAMYRQHKPIAAICHGPWILIDAEIAKKHRVTSWPSLRNDLINAGADWVNEIVVVDKNIITSRKPDDLPDFNRKMIELFAAANPTHDTILSGQGNREFDDPVVPQNS